jgi:FtsH-binding integral membrane protein
LVQAVRFSKFLRLSKNKNVGSALALLSLFTFDATSKISYKDKPALKHSLWFGFLASTALLLIPFINMASIPIIYDAIFATGITVGSLGVVAYNLPSEELLLWGGAIGMLFG